MIKRTGFIHVKTRNENNYHGIDCEGRFYSWEFMQQMIPYFQEQIKRVEKEHRAMHVEEKMKRHAI